MTRISSPVAVLGVAACGAIVAALLLPSCVKTGVKCDAPLVACGNTCVDVTSDANACGACGNVCGSGEVCQGCACVPGTFHPDMALACYWTGEVVPFQSAGAQKGTASRIGSGPWSLARMDDALVVADSNAGHLYEARWPTLQQLDESQATGAQPNQVLVDGEQAYVVNSGDNSLDVFQRPGSGAVPDAGLGLTLAGSISFGTNANPYAAAKIGTDLFVTLNGGFTAHDAPTGQKLVRVSVANPSSPTLSHVYELGGVDLHSFPDGGGAGFPRPAGVVARNGVLYVALNNLDANTYAPNGPGMVARVDPSSGAVTAIDLGGDVCVNSGYLANVGTSLVVSCTGQSTFDSNFRATSTLKSGVVLLNAADQVVDHWSAACPADSDGGCNPINIGPVAVKGSTVFAGDINGGRVFVLDVVGDKLVERRGYNAAAGAPAQACSNTLGPIQGCAFDPRGFSNVADILVAE